MTRFRTRFAATVRIPGRTASLANSNLSGTNLTATLFYNTNLSGANLFGADLTSSNMDGANITHLDLIRANLTGVVYLGVDYFGNPATGAPLSMAL